MINNYPIWHKENSERGNNWKRSKNLELMLSISVIDTCYRVKKLKIKCLLLFMNQFLKISNDEV